jgi:uncharacterized membrane protein YdbT with pleckstrin-like domain
MDNDLFVNEKTHPIENAWIIKSTIYIIIAAIFFGVFIYFYILLKSSGKGYNNLQLRRIFTAVALLGVIVFNCVSIISLILRKVNFKYNFGEKNIILKQGIIAKSERQTFYGRIQNIKINQDFVDRLLGIASLVIETASDSGGAAIMLATKGKDSGKSINRFTSIFPGFASSFIAIPGLSYKNATSLKNFIMERIKANPIDDMHSGL